MQNTSIRFGVVGCGRIGRRHAHIIANHPEATLVALCEPNPNPDDFKEFEGTPLYKDFKTLLDHHHDLDVVCVASPNGLHAEQAVQALEAGLHVVLEKPIALTKSGAEKVIYTALHHSKYVFGVMQNRYSPPAKWLKELVNSGVLGKINMVQVNCYWNRDERYYNGQTWHGNKTLDGGTLFTQFSHFVDILYWVFGDITNIHSRMVDFNHKDLTDFEDSGIVTFDFVNEGIGVINFSTSCWDQNFESSVTVIGQNGTLKIGGQYMDKVEYCHIKDYTMPELAPINPPNDYGPYKGSANNHGYVFNNVMNVLKGKENITTNALEGLKVVEIIERIYKSDKSL